MNRYNTAFFHETGVYGYNYAVVTEEFLSPSITYAPVNHSVTTVEGYTRPVLDNQTSILNLLHGEAVNQKLRNVTASQCMELFGSVYVSKYSNALLISQDEGDSGNSVLEFQQWNSSDQVPFY